MSIIFNVQEAVEGLLNPNNKKCIQQLQENWRMFQENKAVLAIGTGGSYIPAIFVKQMIEKNLNLVCDVKYPFDALYGNINIFSYAIIFSYKMRSYEINELVKKLIESPYMKKILLVTANTEKTYDNEKIEYVIYDSQQFEISYVSFKGVYFPIYLIENSFSNHLLDIPKINENHYQKEITNVIDVFYDDDNYFLAELLERHLCELGIATTRIHEKKDFSHGRMSMVNRSQVIYLPSSHYEFQYEKLLIDYLINEKQCQMLNHITSVSIEKLNYTERTLIWLKWIDEVAKEKGIDIKTKKDTKEDEKLFKFEGGI